MMPSIRRRLDTLAERHQEVALLLAQPEATNDNARFRDYLLKSLYKKAQGPQHKVKK